MTYDRYYYIATSAIRMLHSVEMLRKSAGAGDFDFSSGINHFMAPDRQRSGAFSMSIHPDGGALFWRWLKNFCKYFLRKPYIQGLKCRYSEGLTFMLTILLQENQKIFPKNFHLLPLFCRYSVGADLYQ